MIKLYNDTDVDEYIFKMFRLKAITPILMKTKTMLKFEKRREISIDAVKRQLFPKIWHKWV